jgi:hypothetical protein
VAMAMAMANGQWPMAMATSSPRPQGGGRKRRAAAAAAVSSKLCQRPPFAVRLGARGGGCAPPAPSRTASRRCPEYGHRCSSGGWGTRPVPWRDSGAGDRSRVVPRAAARRSRVRCPEARSKQQAARQPDEAMSSRASGWASSQTRRCRAHEEMRGPASGRAQEGRRQPL